MKTAVIHFCAITSTFLLLADNLLCEKSTFALIIWKPFKCPIFLLCRNAQHNFRIQILNSINPQCQLASFSLWLNTVTTHFRIGQHVFQKHVTPFQGLLFSLKGLPIFSSL